MSEAEFAQCLLLCVHKGKQGVAATTSAASIKFYALLPEVFTTEHPVVLKLFRENGVVIINGFSSLLFNRSDELEFIEVLLQVRSAVAVNISLTVEDMNLQMVKGVFSTIANVSINSNTKVTKIYPAIDNSNASIMKSILSKGMTIVYKHSSGESLLHLAARRGHRAFAEIILECGSDVDSKCADGSTALHVAVNRGHRSIIDLLLQNGADVDTKTKKSVTPLHVAVKKHHAEIIDVLVQNGANTECKTANVGSTALHVAVERSPCHIVETLLRNGANIESKTNNGLTPLHVAVRKNHLDVVELLLQNGADVECRDNDGRTPLIVGAYKSGRESSNFLLRYGACLNVKHLDDAFALERNDQNEKLGKASSHSLMELLLANCLTDPEFLGASGKMVIGPMQYTHFTRIPMPETYSDHLVKVTVANLCSFTSFVPQFVKGLHDFKAECELEVTRMKECRVGDGNLFYFDILTKNVSQVARFLRNSSVAEALSSAELHTLFPNYGDILKWQFLKGNQRKLALEEGVKTIDFVSGLFGKLPREIKEGILDYLNLRDILILKHARAHTNL